MTGVDKDLATLRETLNAFGVVSHNLQANRDATRIQASLAALARVEAELSRLREERDELYEANWPWEWVVATQEKERRRAAEARCARLQQALRGLLREWPDGECFCGVRGTDGGVDHMPGCAEARDALAGPDTPQKCESCARLQQALAGLESAVRILDVMLREPAAEGLMSAEDYRSYVQGAWLGVDEAAEKARKALAGTDTPAHRKQNVEYWRARARVAGEECARQQQALERIAELYEIGPAAQIAREALAGQPTAAEGPDTPADSPEPREGIVMVYDWQHRYLGCMGIERWERLLSEDAEARTDVRRAGRFPVWATAADSQEDNT